MSLAGLYQKLPTHLQPPVKYFYRLFTQSGDDISDDFIFEFFTSREEYNTLASSGRSKIGTIVTDAISAYNSQVSGVDSGSWAGVSIDRAAAYYALVRIKKPDIVVETGVCNGVSSLAILLAMDENNKGELYSVDLPVNANSTLPEAVARVKEKGEPFSALPPDKSPGWIVPQSLRSRWELTLGRSQRNLPTIFEKVGDVDIFIHDSEHTAPCMMFEYELAWEWLAADGVLISDDVHANNAFETFTEIRAGRSGSVGARSGFALR